MDGTGLRSAACSHVGLVRKLNEDAYLDRPDLGLWAVADGMGGMTAGEVASGAIAAALDGIPAELAPPALTAEVLRRMEAVNLELIRLAQGRGEGTVIGSTVAGLIVRQGHFACFWTGDSRVYRLRDGELDQLTHDHSLVQEMVDSGLLAPEAAERHPHASVLQRAVGVEEPLRLDWVHAPVRPGDLFLLCSDGLTRNVPDPEIEAVLAHGSIDAARDRLLALTLERGARDNVTIILVSA